MLLSDSLFKRILCKLFKHSLSILQVYLEEAGGALADSFMGKKLDVCPCCDQVGAAKNNKELKTNKK